MRITDEQIILQAEEIHGCTCQSCQDLTPLAGQRRQEDHEFRQYRNDLRADLAYVCTACWGLDNQCQACGGTRGITHEQALVDDLRRQDLEDYRQLAKNVWAAFLNAPTQEIANAFAAWINSGRGVPSFARKDKAVADRNDLPKASEREIYRVALIDLADAIMSWNASDNLNGFGLDPERANQIFNLVNYGVH